MRRETIGGFRLVLGIWDLNNSTVTFEFCNQAYEVVLVIQQCVSHWGVFFQMLHDTNRWIFKGFLHRTLLLPEHHSSAADGTSITVSRNTRFWLEQVCCNHDWDLIAYFRASKETTDIVQRNQKTSEWNPLLHRAVSGNLLNTVRLTIILWVTFV